MSHNPGYSFSYTAGAGNGGSKTAVSGGGGVGTPGGGASTVGAGSGYYISSGAGNGGFPSIGTFAGPVQFPLEPLETGDPVTAPLKQRVKELEDKVSSLKAITQEQAVCLQELYSLIDSLKQNKSRQSPLEESDYWKER